MHTVVPYPLQFGQQACSLQALGELYLFLGREKGNTPYVPQIEADGVLRGGAAIFIRRRYDGGARRAAAPFRPLRHLAFFHHADSLLGYALEDILQAIRLHILGGKGGIDLLKSEQTALLASPRKEFLKGT